MMNHTRAQEENLKSEVSAIHKQHISVKLRLLERTLVELGRALQNPPPASPLIHYTDIICERQRPEVCAFTSEARREIETIASDLDLPIEEESIVRALIASLHVRAINLVELHARYLRSGGAVPPVLANYIDSKADRLEAIVRRLISLLESKPASHPDYEEQ